MRECPEFCLLQTRSRGARCVLRVTGTAPTSCERGAARGTASPRADRERAGRARWYRQLSIIGTLGCRNIDFPVVLDLVKRGRLQVEPLVTHRHSLEEVNAGYDLLRKGEGVRHIVVFDRSER